MKKLILTSALCFAASMAYAQNNTAVIDQQANGNNAVATQTGEGNSAELLQQVKDNYADILQTGDFNILRNSILGGSGAAVQRATSYLDLDQTGNGNVVGLNQNNQKNSAYITQTGNYNIADVSQVAFGGPVNGNETQLSQIGDDNMTQVVQGINGGNHSDNTASITVTGSGNGNTAVGSQGDDFMTIEQYGDFNSATVNIEGDFNDTDIEQDGDNNSASADVYNGSSYNTVEMAQTGGNGNSASYRVGAGEYNDLTLSQTGDQNISNVQVLSGADNNTSDITQNGYNNRGLWVISGGGTFMNGLTAMTTGDNNKATGQISGANNTIMLTQTGNLNTIGLSGQWNAKDGVVISGDLNMVDVSQLSDGNTAVVNVSGNSNTATVTQQ